MSAVMQHDLFRSSAIKNHANRLHGQIILQSTVSSRLITFAITIVVIMAIAWVVLASYARTEPAKGIMVPADGASKIFALHPGVVTAVTVKEGDMVKAGERLAIVTLETPNAAGTFGTLETLDSLHVQRVLADEQLRLSHRHQAIDLAKFESVITGLHEQEKTIVEQIDLQKEVVTSTAATFEQLGAVVAKGFVSKLEYERRRQSALAARQELSRLNQQLASTRSDTARTVNERTSTDLEGKNQQASTKSAIENLRQQRSRVKGEASYLIEAPVSGRVTAVQTAVGQTVSNLVPMMIIMPVGSRLRADVYVPSRAIGFIKPGQEVRLLYDAFPYQRFGSFSAHVDTISQVAIAGSEANAPFKIDEPVYKISVVPERQLISAYGKPVVIQPGMTLVANIVLERQSFLDWFLSPLRAVAKRS